MNKSNLQIEEPFCLMIPGRRFMKGEEQQQDQRKLANQVLMHTQEAERVRWKWKGLETPKACPQ